MKYYLVASAVASLCAVGAYAQDFDLSVAEEQNAVISGLEEAVADIMAASAAAAATAMVQDDHPCNTAVESCAYKCAALQLSPFINYCIRSGQQIQAKCQCMTLSPDTRYDNDYDVETVVDAADALHAMKDQLQCPRADQSRAIALYHGRGGSSNMLAWFISGFECTDGPIDYIIDQSAPLGTDGYLLEVSDECESRRTQCDQACALEGGYFGYGGVESFQCAANTSVELSSFNVADRDANMVSECVCNVQPAKINAASVGQSMQSALQSVYDAAYQAKPRHAKVASMLLLPAFAMAAMLVAALLYRRKRAHAADDYIVVPPTDELGAKIVETSSYSFADDKSDNKK